MNVVNRSGLIVLQAVGALSILPYPFVVLANVMSLAAPGRSPVTSAFWIALSFYPFVWIALDIFAWRSMSRGDVHLAFGLSSIPALCTLVAIGVYVFSWAAFGLGTIGIGNGGLHSTTLPTNNPAIDSVILAVKDIDINNNPAQTVERTLRRIDENRGQMNAAVAPYGSALNAALSGLPVSLDRPMDSHRVDLVRGLVARGARLTAEESADLRKSWALRRALFEGPVKTAEQNPLVWRIVTHDRGKPKPFNPLTDPVPDRSAPAFVLAADEHALLNRPTDLHGTPLYAALLDNAPDVCAVLIQAGARLSSQEQNDPAASAALRELFNRAPELKGVYEAQH